MQKIWIKILNDWNNRHYWSSCSCNCLVYYESKLTNHPETRGFLFLSEYENEYFELVVVNYRCVIFAKVGSRSTLIMYWSQVRILAGPPLKTIKAQVYLNSLISDLNWVLISVIIFLSKKLFQSFFFPRWKNLFFWLKINGLMILSHYWISCRTKY